MKSKMIENEKFVKYVCKRFDCSKDEAVEKILKSNSGRIEKWYTDKKRKEKGGF